MNPQYRQGDVLLQRIGGLPADATLVQRDDTGRLVLVYGEATGHAHAVLEPEADLYAVGGTATADAAERWLQVRARDGVSVVHEEHAPVKLPPGTYRVIRQREYAPQAIRRVRD